MRNLTFLRFVSVCAFLLVAVLPARAFATPAAGYWWNPVEPGRGFVIEIQGTTMFMAGFLYSSSGEATWVASSGAMTSSTQYSGSLITYNGGQTLTGAFKQAQLSTPAIGTIAITFTSDTAGSVTVNAGGTQVVIPIVRFDIVPGGSSTAQPATNPQTGWWWNENEGGRGFAIEVQNGVMYFAGYMYDASGNPTWYLSYGNMTNASLFQGEWLQLGNGQTLTGKFQQSAVVNPSVGTVTLQIANNSVATLTLPDGRQIPFTRYNFGVSGFTLQAFTPTGTTPTQALQITGSGFDPAQSLTLTLSDANGYSVTIPPASETTTQFTVSVPPYLNALTSAFGSGTVSLQATQGTTVSNTLPGFQIQALPKAGNAPGTSTLSLVRASLLEAQRLQLAIHGTTQDTPALETAIGNQITNLQTLVTSVQSVVQSGTSFSLGVVGGANIVVTSANISDVDNLIIATLQSLAAPGVGGSALKTEQGAGPTCLSAEANAFATAAVGGTVNTDALAQSFIAAACNSSLCQAPANFLPAYRLYAGVGSTGLGVINQGGFGTTPKNPSAAALLSTLIGNSASSVALNNLVCLKSTTDQTSVQTGVANLTKLQQPTFTSLLPKTSGQLAQTLVGALTVSNVIAPPPPSSAGGISGTWTGNYTVASPSACQLQGGSWTANFIDNNGALSGTWISDDGSTGTISGVETGGAASWSSVGATSIFVTATITGGTQLIASFSSTADCKPVGPKSGTMFGTKSVVATSANVPANLPTGTYNYGFAFNVTQPGSSGSGSGGPIMKTDSDPVAFAATIQSSINSFNANYCNLSGVTCSAVATPFDGTTWQVVYTLSGTGYSGTITHTLTKTG